MSQFIFGPVVTGDGLVMTSLIGTNYVLKYDPNPEFGLYFSVATGTSDYVPFNANISETGGLTLTSSGRSLIYDPNLQTVTLTNAVRANMNYVYSTGQNVRLLAGENVSLINVDQGQLILRFGYKTPTQEATDLASYQRDPLAYRPVYSGFTQEVFYVPIASIPGNNCNVLQQNSAYLAYSGKPTTASVFYTEQNWCQNKTQPGICAPTQSCGSCYGVCSGDQICSPVENGTNLSCQTPGQKGPWYESTWFIVLAIVVGLVLLAAIIFVIISTV